jgi:hypothetical protein
MAKKLDLALILALLWPFVQHVVLERDKTLLGVG